ncbi:MAG: helix-turn-helix domain-containing protein [Microbacterium sp.]
MPRLTEETRRRRREQIAQAALRVYERDGFDRTTIADIIEESGLSAGAIYTHFSNKADLVKFVAEEQFAFVGDAIPEALRTPSEVLEVLFEQIPAKRLAPIVLQVIAVAVRGGELADLPAIQVARIRSVVSQLLNPWVSEQPADAREQLRADVTQLLVTSMQGRILGSAMDPDFNDAALLSAVRAAFG